MKSLGSLPPGLTMMDEKLDWTQEVGDAFLGQQKELMDAPAMFKFDPDDSWKKA